MKEPLRFTSALANGRDLYAFRYSANDKANSLYYRESGDNVVIPRVFSAAEGEVIHLPDVGHMGLLFSPAVFRAVHQRLLLASGRPED